MRAEKLNAMKIQDLNRYTQYITGWKESKRGNNYKEIDGYIYVITNHIDHDIDRVGLFHIVRAKLNHDKKTNQGYFPVPIKHQETYTEAKDALYNWLYQKKSKKEFEI